MTYHGGMSDYVWVREGMRIGNVVKLMEEAMGEWLGERRLWYTTKYDRWMIFLVQGDADVWSVWKLIKGNDEFVYMHVVEKDDTIRKKVQVSEAVHGRNLKGGSCVGGKGVYVGVANNGVHNGGGMACMGIRKR